MIIIAEAVTHRGGFRGSPAAIRRRAHDLEKNDQTQHRRNRYCLATRTVTAEIRGHTIGHGVNVPWMPLVLADYLFATPGSLLLGGDRRPRILGVVLAVGALACSALWRLESASTRCAFAAVASLLVLGWVRRPPTASPVT
ncbi:DUF6629 family protein [Streptomyces sp. NPDC085639]|uniref:DUF6629 family protein n=1 Tax=Streptomyces sp. NPDC085639 TaxID=3365734 RepID=UPI0037D349BA